MFCQQFELYALPGLRHAGSNGWMIRPMTCFITAIVADLRIIIGDELAHERRDVPGLAEGFNSRHFRSPSLALFGAFDSLVFVQVVFTAPISVPDYIWFTE